MREDDTIRKVLLRFLCLPYLPAGQIRETVQQIVLELSDRVKRIIQNFLDYYERQWLNSVTPDGMSIHNLERRSTNALEAHNAVMLRNLGIRPTAWDFVRKFFYYSYFRRFY